MICSSHYQKYDHYLIIIDFQAAQEMLQLAAAVYAHIKLYDVHCENYDSFR